MARINVTGSPMSKEGRGEWRSRDSMEVFQDQHYFMTRVRSTRRIADLNSHIFSDGTALPLHETNNLLIYSIQKYQG